MLYSLRICRHFAAEAPDLGLYQDFDGLVTLAGSQSVSQLELDLARPSRDSLSSSSKGLDGGPE